MNEYVELFGGFILGSGLGWLGMTGVYKYRDYLAKKKVAKMVEEIKLAGAQEIQKAKDGLKEVSELSFRDKYGFLQTVKIIIDHDLEDMTDEDREKIKQMVTDPDVPTGTIGRVGTMGDLMSGDKFAHDEEMKKIDNFVFSPRAVEDMRKAGVEPDEVVTKMLKASGRML